MPSVPNFSQPIPICGREPEKEILFRAYRSAKSGSVNLVVLGGPSGVGKTMLARALSDMVLMEKGIFASGKFNSSGESSLQQTFGRILQDLTQHLLSWEKPSLDAFQERLLSRVEGTARILTDLAPDLALVLGLFPSLPLLPPHEARNRFQRCVGDFLQVFGELNCHLTLLLDDLQWADPDSIALLAFLMSDPALKSVLWMATTREDPARFPSQLETAAKNAGSTMQAAITILPVAPWNREEHADFIAVAFQVRRPELDGLADLVYAKARGNPFHAVQLLKTLSEERTICQGNDSGNWYWDANRIKRMPVTEDVTALIRDRAFRLSPGAIEVLKVAACLGYEFQVEMLCDATGESSERLFPILNESLECELLVSLSETGSRENVASLAFQHDQVRQAIYGSIPVAERRKIHLQIGRRLLNLRGNAGADFASAEISDHLIEGLEEVELPGERRRIAELALKSAHAARNEAAFSLALRRCIGGIRALPEDAWATQYSLSRGLYQICAESQYITGDIGASEGNFKLVVDRSANPVDRALALAAWMAVREHSLEHAGALSMGLVALKELGHHLSDKPSMASLTLPLLEILTRLRLRPPNLPTDAPVLTEDNLAAMRLLSYLWTAAFLDGNEKMHGLAVLLMMRISLRNGDSEFSPLAWICFAIFRSSIMKNREEGYRLAEHAMRLADRFGNPVMIGRVRFLSNCFFDHHQNSYRHSFGLAQKTFVHCRNAGDWLYAGYFNHLECYFMLLQGFHPKRIELETREMEVFARSAGHKATLENIAILRRRSDILGDSFLDPQAALKEDFSVEAIATAKVEKGFFLICEWEMAVLFKRWPLARRISRELSGNPTLDPSGCFYPESLVYEGLTLSASYAEAPWREKRRIRAKLLSTIRTLRAFSSRCPENFASKQALVQAEWLRLKGRHEQACAEYERAAVSAEAAALTQYEALANERAGELCSSVNRPIAALAYLGGAYRAYLRMGALAKAEDIRRRFPGLDSAMNRYRQEEKLNRDVFFGFMRAARAISSEIVLPRLLRNLMEVFARISGSHSALLLFPKEIDFSIGAEWPMPARTAATEPSGPGASAVELPVSVLNYVARTERTVSLPDPEFDFLFKSDDYLAKHGPKSALCMPLLFQGKLLALLYLENHAINDAFNADRTQFLQLLANQAAISISNARFHALQLEAQQSKINPHFLFNALNSIAELTLIDSQQAEKAILQLANLYRYILRQMPDHLVHLEQELEIVQSYLHLEKMRLGKKLSFDIHVEGATSSIRIPGLLIQPLVENSVKHGVAPKLGPGRIDIRIEVDERRCRISVQDDGAGANAPLSSGSGFGLKSIQERLVLIYHQDFSFAISKESGYRVEIEIPISPIEPGSPPGPEAGSRGIGLEFQGQRTRDSHAIGIGIKEKSQVQG